MDNGIKPNHLWHRTGRKHFWWLVKEKICARCPVQPPVSKRCVKLPCCQPHNHRGLLDMLKLMGLVLGSTVAFLYAFGKFKIDFLPEPQKEPPPKGILVTKDPCDNTPETPPCICEDAKMQMEQAFLAKHKKEEKLKMKEKEKKKELKKLQQESDKNKDPECRPLK